VIRLYASRRVGGSTMTTAGWFSRSMKQKWRLMPHLIPVKQRRDLVCHICKTTKSVKYEHNFFHYCNKCVVLVMKETDGNMSTEA